ncbi:MAG: hypothetical protein AB1611_02745 [bacterium]
MSKNSPEAALKLIVMTRFLTSHDLLYQNNKQISLLKKLLHSTLEFYANISPDPEKIFFSGLIRLSGEKIAG